MIFTGLIKTPDSDSASFKLVYLKCQVSGFRNTTVKSPVAVLRNSCCVQSLPLRTED